MLIDEVVITVKGGNGGNGAISFKRNAQTAKGGPDGGNGGNGGNLYIQGENDVDTLTSFRYKKEIKAEDGISGGRYNLYGRNGQDTVINVPLGTVITNLEDGDSFEITNETDRILIAKGGKGGRGNNEFKTSTIQAPKYRELGKVGEVKKIKLELKLIADIGLVGLPNAGKSSLLSVLTNAHPKIADYPFTTLEPNLGVMEGLIIADIPGLIEGASTGKGLGDKFLKHIERTKLLVHCIDSSSEDALNDYKTIRKELEDFSPLLLEKEEIIVLTKSDLIDEARKKELSKKFSKIKAKIFLLSLYENNSIEELKRVLLNHF